MRFKNHSDPVNCKVKVLVGVFEKLSSRHKI